MEQSPSSQKDKSCPEIVYTRHFIYAATSKFGRFFLSIEPSVLKWHGYLKLYRITFHTGLNIDNYSSRDVFTSIAIVAFLFAYQLRYLVLMFNKPKDKMSLAMGDYMALLGDARNGLLLGFWAGVMQAFLIRTLFVFYSRRKSLPFLTDWKELSLFVHRCSSKKQVNEWVVKLEKRLLCLFEFTKITTEGISWVIMLFQGFLIFLTALELESMSDQLVLILWSISLVPATFLAATGAISAIIAMLNGVVYSHYKLDLLMVHLEKLNEAQVNNGEKEKIVANLIEVGKCTIAVLGAINKQSKIVGQFLIIFLYLTTLVASSLSYLTIYVNFEANWLRWVLAVPVIQIWSAVIFAPLAITHVATRTGIIYRKLFTLHTRLPLPLEGKLYLKKLISITGSDQFPVAYYTAFSVPYTLQYHGSFILNIFQTIFLIISFLER